MSSHDTFQPEHRVDYDGFAAIEWNDVDEVREMRESLTFDAPLEVSWVWDYVGQVEQLRKLYDLSKDRMWDAEKDLDWSCPVDRENEYGMAVEYSPVAQTLRLMGEDEAKVREASWDGLAYVCSQLLHGEQAALEICGQLTAICPDMDMKFFAGAQVFDEVRHIEAFSKFIQRKLGRIYPIDPNVKFLLEQILQADSWQKKTLGMQTLFEGMALGIMKNIDRGTDIPLLHDMLTRIRQDESRHAAFGIISMQKTMDDENTSPEMKAELEDWAYRILECLNAGQHYGVLSALGPKWGIDARSLSQVLYGMEHAVQEKSLLYTHAVIPYLKRLGLITERTVEGYKKVAIFESFDDIETELDTTREAFAATA